MVQIVYILERGVGPVFKWVIGRTSVDQPLKNEHKGFDDWNRGRELGAWRSTGSLRDIG